MINMEYSVWKNTCNGFFELNNSITNKYLQLYPFTLLSNQEKERIASKDFFNTFIKNGALFSESATFETPNRYLQKPDGTFRVTKLISPFLFLYLLAIGTQISNEYKSSRNNTIVYHAGDISNFSYHYKKSYNDYYISINEAQECYEYFIKIDLSNFFNSLNINELFKKINRNNDILDPRTMYIYKNILNMIGADEYPTVENNAGLSYLATHVYLDDSDTSIERYLDSFGLINNFQLIRYVDDLFIFFNCKEENYNVAITTIKNQLISIYAHENLSMNEKKFSFGISENVDNILKSALYGFYMNGIEVDFSKYYSSQNLVYFFDLLVKACKEHNHETYKKILENSFKKENIKYSDQEIFQYFLFHQSNLFKQNDVKLSIKKIIYTDYNILKYSINEMVTAICNTEDGAIIKQLLRQIFNRYRSCKSDVFDETIIIAYLINRNFCHKDLKKSLTALNNDVSKFIEKNCISSFFGEFEKNMKFNYLYKKDGKKYSLFDDDILWMLFFMFNYSKKTGKQLEAYAFLKTFFDRFIAHIMNCSDIETCGKNNKPNFKKYFKDKTIINGLKQIGIVDINGVSIEQMLQKAHKLRNDSPLNHATSGIFRDTHIKTVELLESQTDLQLIIDTCLERVSHFYIS